MNGRQKRKAKALSCAHRYVFRWLWRRQVITPEGGPMTLDRDWKVTTLDISFPCGPGWAAIRKRYRRQRLGRGATIRFTSFETLRKRWNV